MQLNYKIKPGRHTLFSQKMFGRMYTRRQYKKYIPGILHDIPHYKLFNSQLLISTVGPIDLEPIMKYCDKFEIRYIEQDEEYVHMITGKQRIVGVEENGKTTTI